MSEAGDRTAAPPPAPTVVLGVLCVIFGGLVAAHSPLGVPFLVAGAWFATGRGLRELRRMVEARKGAALGWTIGLAFFCAALFQAWFALLPMVPLFLASALFLPPVRDACHALTGRSLPPLLREALLVALLCGYGYLVACDLAGKADAARLLIGR